MVGVDPMMSFDICDGPMLEDPMTLVLAGEATDGVVVAVDCLELLGTNGDCRRDARKCLPTNGGCLVAFGGSGLWVESIVDSGRTGIDSDEPGVVAEAIRDEMRSREDFPRNPCFVAGLSNGSPRLYYFDWRGHDGNGQWMPVVRAARSAMWFGATTTISNLLLSRLMNRSVSCEELAGAFLAAHALTARYNAYVDPHAVLHVKRNGGWTSASEDVARGRASRIVDYIDHALERAT